MDWSIRLWCELLESRDVPNSTFGPALEIPGYAGPVQEAVGDVNGDGRLDRAVVALEGGSCRVYVVSADGRVLLDTIEFGDDFRGGGSIAIIPASTAAWGSGLSDPLYVTPGPGGGPRVTKFSFDASSGRLVATASFFAPFPESFRGGLRISHGDLTGDSVNEVLFLPAEGGSPLLAVVDLKTNAAIAQFFVGPGDDRSGDWRFMAEGGSTLSPSGQWAVSVQLGFMDPITFRVADAGVWTLGGVDLAEEFADRQP